MSGHLILPGHSSLVENMQGVMSRHVVSWSKMQPTMMNVAAPGDFQISRVAFVRIRVRRDRASNLLGLLNFYQILFVTMS
jgi:hypothetical protein